MVAGSDNSGIRTEYLCKKLFGNLEDGLQDLSQLAKVGPGDRNGLDGLFIKTVNGRPLDLTRPLAEIVANIEHVYIPEAKQFNGQIARVSRGNTSTLLPQQMTDAWLQNVFDRMVQAKGKKEILALALQEKFGALNQQTGFLNQQVFTKTLIAIKKDTEEILLLKLK